MTPKHSETFRGGRQLHNHYSSLKDNFCIFFFFYLGPIFTYVGVEMTSGFKNITNPCRSFSIFRAIVPVRITSTKSGSFFHPTGSGSYTWCLKRNTLVTPGHTPCVSLKDSSWSEISRECCCRKMTMQT